MNLFSGIFDGPAGISLSNTPSWPPPHFRIRACHLFRILGFGGVAETGDGPVRA